MKIGKFGKSPITLVLAAWVGICGTASAQSSLTLERASAIVSPFYDAINAPTPDETTSLVKKATSTDWISCDAPEDCRGQKETIAVFSQLRKSVPNLKWQRKDMLVSGDDVIVRGEFTGTPIGVFLGIEPTGKSFRTMSIDVHTIKNGKMIRSYHVENWAEAMQQLAEK